jgi:AraC family transcriptional regulator
LISFKTRIAVKGHRGWRERLNESIASFIEGRKQTNHSPVAIRNSFGILYDDPAAVAPEGFRFEMEG